MKLSVIFLLSRTKLNSRGKCPIRCRLTYRKRRKEFSTGLFVEPAKWNLKNYSVENDLGQTNQQLALIKQGVNQAYMYLQICQTPFEVDDILRKYKGENLTKEIGVNEIYRMHTERLRKLVGKEIQLVTLRKYIESGNHVSDFIRWKFKSDDISTSKIKSNFVEEFEFYLITEKNLQNSTINKVIQRFRRVIRYAISEDYLSKDPFLLYRPRTIKKEVVFLTKGELKQLEEKELDIMRLQKVRDMFVFCCYTGLGFKEMVNLKRTDIIEEFDGRRWIHVRRQKTGRMYKVPLLPKALSIIKKYEVISGTNVLPNICNQPFNTYLKEIASIAGIRKHLTHHIARKTFATTVLLYNNVPIEIVSKLLGHSKIQTTQDYYGRILDKQVSRAISLLEEKL